MIDIIGKKKVLYAVSGALFILGALALAVYGLKPGIDFTGGSLVEVGFRDQALSADQVEQAIAPLNLGPVITQATGDNGMILRLRFINETEHEQILQAIRQAAGGQTGTSTSAIATPTPVEGSSGTPAVIEKSFETIGATVSQQLRDRATKASVVITLVIGGFIAYAFRKVSRPVESWKYGVAAVVAMIHDVVITMGVFALLGKYFGIEVDTPFVVAMLTVFGYSVNDTIVVFDRIRENLLRRGSGNFAETVNAAVNETMARSINTSMTMLIVLVALFFLGGASIKYFALALIIGIFLGTYSSIFVASALLVSWQDWRLRRRAA